MSIKIDEEFKNLIPPLTDEEFAQLEENCVREGIRDPLVVWALPNGEKILLDGHNRWAISAKHSGIRFQIKEMHFDSREGAMSWIIQNQLGRRNISIYEKVRLSLQLKPMIEKAAKERMLNPMQNSAQGTTRQELARIAGVSHDTIHKVETIENSGDEYVKEQARNGELSINKAYQRVTGTESKSPQKAMREFLEQKTKEHEAFLEEKKEKVVDLASVREDNERMKLLAADLYVDWLRIDKIIFDVLFKIDEKIDFKGVFKVLSDSQKKEMQGVINNCRSLTDELERRLIAGE